MRSFSTRSLRELASRNVMQTMPVSLWAESLQAGALHSAAPEALDVRAKVLNRRRNSLVLDIQVLADLVDELIKVGCVGGRPFLLNGRHWLRYVRIDGWV
eukprot:TRINITY_DN14737_c2_g1_i1.p2 TRINITY_DN14737_c2_g1~~TRINITY_DN14737_c2_g1_i1.p2  ORF type:complete len:100 (-),score=3.01 TRINITY_DN14737_c2_g1_i1:155-454(-)